METAIKKIDGVKDATVSFMTQKMTIETDDERFDDIVKEAVKVRRIPCHKRRQQYFSAALGDPAKFAHGFFGVVEQMQMPCCYAVIIKE